MENGTFAHWPRSRGAGIFSLESSAERKTANHRVPRVRSFCPGNQRVARQSFVQTLPKLRQLQPMGQITDSGVATQPRTEQIPSSAPGTFAQVGASPPHSVSSVQTTPKSELGSCGPIVPPKPPMPPSSSSEMLMQELLTSSWSLSQGSLSPQPSTKRRASEMLINK